MVAFVVGKLLVLIVEELLELGWWQHNAPHALNHFDVTLGGAKVRRLQVQDRSQNFVLASEIRRFINRNEIFDSIVILIRNDAYLCVRQLIVLPERGQGDRLASGRGELLAEGGKVLLDGRRVHVLGGRVVLRLVRAVIVAVVLHDRQLIEGVHRHLDWLRALEGLLTRGDVVVVHELVNHGHTLLRGHVNAVVTTQ